MFFNAEQECRSILFKLNIQDVNEEDLMDIIDHGELVAILVDMLAYEMGIDDERLELLHNSALLHDVGKLQLSENIYGRDKKSLHVEEVRHMREHAKLGAEMLRRCNYSKELVDAVYHHHESLDGSGYPDNLRGNEISLEARILKICDVFAALVSDRPYRRAFDKSTAISMMIEDNKAYDIKIFMDFMNMSNEKRFERIMQRAEENNEKHKYWGNN